MNKQIQQANDFHNLHVKGNPLILFNIWDAGSAIAVSNTGARAIATGSWSVAAAFGFEDGEKIPLPLVLDNIKRIVKATDLPVSIDIESGYGKTPADVEQTIKSVIEAGAIGINLEDQNIANSNLYTIEQQCERIKATRTAADKLAMPLFINARCDIFLQLDASEHTTSHLDKALERAVAYQNAGASGFFVPGLREQSLIENLCGKLELPVNIMMTKDSLSHQQLASLGVARISHGPNPYRKVIKELEFLHKKAII